MASLNPGTRHFFFLKLMLTKAEKESPAEQLRFAEKHSDWLKETTFNRSAFLSVSYLFYAKICYATPIASSRCCHVIIKLVYVKP